MMDETIFRWSPAHFRTKRRFLEERAWATRAARRFFEDRDFIEVETPILQVSGGMEPHLRMLETTVSEPFGDSAKRYQLQTSPEFAMKKLLAGGMERIVQFAKAFRDGERSPLHSPEFTMLEWYRAGGTLDGLMADCEALFRALPFWAGPVPIHEPFERLSIAEAFTRYAGIDVFACIADLTDPDPDPAALTAEAKRIGLHVGAEDRFEDVFFRILLEKIEPHLGAEKPTFLFGYPACMAALAERDPLNSGVALRFELYVKGVELANAFQELTDPVEQRARFEHDAALKQRLYGTEAVIDEEFLEALAHMPPSAGIALGWDRLVMLALGAETIDAVTLTP